MLKFADTFKGTLATESMLVRGISDNSETIEGVADFSAKLKPDIAYLAVPIRPPAVATVTAASEQVINMAYQIFNKRLSNVEYLIGYEGNAFASTGNARDDLLNITLVHPIREEALAEFLNRANTGWDCVQDLIKSHSLVETEYQGKKFYMRKLPVLNLPHS
jgi:wyosine [tRNA(Phe)-imidazoG37] synthetase (radical SAM superfamily)